MNSQPTPESAASSAPDAVDPTPCRLLRSKKYFFLKSPPRSGEELLDGSCALWCERTQQAIGPDNGLVEVAGCVRGRACFQERPQA